MKERTKLLLIALIFLLCYAIPWGHPTIKRSGFEAFMMLQEYAREHVLTCLIPAFFIAGAISVFVSQASALLLAGPALSLPNMLVIGSVMGVKKTATFCVIIVILSSFAGICYGWIAG